MEQMHIRRIADALEELVLMVKSFDKSGVEPVSDFAARMDSCGSEADGRERMLLAQLGESQARERELEAELVRLNARLARVGAPEIDLSRVPKEPSDDGSD